MDARERMTALIERSMDLAVKDRAILKKLVSARGRLKPKGIYSESQPDSQDRAYSGRLQRATRRVDALKELRSNFDQKKISVSTAYKMLDVIMTEK